MCAHTLYVCPHIPMRILYVCVLILLCAYSICVSSYSYAMGPYLNPNQNAFLMSPNRHLQARAVLALLALLASFN
jgi:hypothetical protein